MAFSSPQKRSEIFFVLVSEGEIGGGLMVGTFESFGPVQYKAFTNP